MTRILTLTLAALSAIASSRAAEPRDARLPEDCYGVYTWHSWNPRQTTAATHPLIKGVPIVMRWGDIEPENGKFRFDTVLGARLQAAQKNGFYGKAHRRNTDRYIKIAANFAARGARQGDPPKALGGGMRSRQRDDYNDVGWGILRGNYWRFLEQINPDQTSVGHWHVGPKEHIFSRFARGFQHSSGKKAMHFRLDKQVDVTNAIFTRSLPGGADLTCQYLSGDDTIFHLIEMSAK